jgi:hypothetical protein
MALRNGMQWLSSKSALPYAAIGSVVQVCTC